MFSSFFFSDIELLRKKLRILWYNKRVNAEKLLKALDFFFFIWGMNKWILGSFWASMIRVCASFVDQIRKAFFLSFV